MNVYYDEGFKAGYDGQSKDNPYLSCGCLFKMRQWESGYQDGCEEREDKQKPVA